MATYVVGFKEEADRDYLRGLKQLLTYDPDQIQMLYATPHRWTPYYREAAKRKVIQPDIQKWDYKHQVLASQNVPPWRILFWVKFIEAVMQLRPQSLWRLLTHRDRGIRAAMRWYYSIGRKVWFYEIWNFFVKDSTQKNGSSLGEFWGEPQDWEQYALGRYTNLAH
jgi:anaerobic magnesium-protoporphyrin IX monomethyl ester cyclase